MSAGAPSSSDAASDEDRAVVTALLGRPPAGAFRVVVRRSDGAASVIANAPLLDDGTPMPTRYWLVDRDLREAVSRLEAAGGVREAERQLDPEAVARAHARYAAERDVLLPAGHTGPRPSGGVGGTRRGVKCLHAHLAWWLAGGEDPIGAWVAKRLGVERLLGPARPDDHPSASEASDQTRDASTATSTASC